MTDGFGYWLAGFVDGEGHFGFQRHKRRGNVYGYFALNLRSDDAQILHLCRERTGVGMVFEHTSRGANPKTYWRVGDKEGCLTLVHLFERYPLRSKKARDFAIWAQAVRYWNAPLWYLGLNSRGHREILFDWEPLARYADAIRTVRAYA